MRNLIWIPVAVLMVAGGVLISLKWRAQQQAAPAGAPGYQYYVLNVGDLTDGLEKYPNEYASGPSGWKLPDGKPQAGPTSPPAARVPTRQEELHTRVIREVNRLGNEGWELCKSDGMLPQYVVRPEIAIVFRRVR